ncbi:MAG: MFS transporter [Desulfobacula sp.]|jgi:MFS transporter, FSR family, fosmidomycin resistance protein|uniref:MFS transporter n=1 Tax=Desulfobacula sp. TaxID=2593537 RepID=UPI001E0E5486|nr:MFS transporter [Desulfobacula sp.]MBT3807101.1 MFS transporter [Desulfobacula sp.]MBT4027335.1 MFS transporter [Desulfobacula sp.]MBT4200507.1 MFS transporter [Desulfobacula sp.]MBT4508908.1 MFS transporter [Desulfobacula sp.]
MKTNKFQTGRVALVSFSHFIHDMYTSFLSPLLPIIIEKLSLSLSQAGLLSTVMQIPALLNPFIGLFADNKGLARWLVVLAPTFTAIPMSLILHASSYYVLLVLLFFAGISVALYHVPSPVLIAKYSGGKKGRGMSIFMTGGESARTFGPMFAVAAVSFLGADHFYVVIGFAVLTSVMLYFALEKEEQKTSFKRKGSLKASFHEIKHVLIPLSGILSARSFMHASMGVFITVFVERETGSLWYGGAALALYEAFGVAGVLSAGTLSDWLGRQRVLFWVLLVAPVAILIFVFSTGILKIIMLAVTGFTVLSTTPVMLAIIQENAKEHPSTANGLFMMISFAVRSIAVLLAGIIGDLAGLENMFIVSAVIGFTAIPFLLKLGIKT